MRWTAPENLHLTLRFIGEVSLIQAEKIRVALEDVQAKSFSLHLWELGFFDRRAQAILWAGLDESQDLLLLKSRVDTALAAHANLQIPQGRFSPHITLGRMKNADRKALREFTAQHSNALKSEFPVTGFTLFSSVLAPDGAKHTIEARYSLIS
ncbi:MAG: RNA 2',3'-cyclic phosphodiesterase [Desulfovibrio sp.]